MERARQALVVLCANPAFWAELRAQVDAFFAAYPAIPPTEQHRDLMTVIVFRRLTSGDQPQEKTA